MSEGAGKKVGKEKEACDTTLGDKPRAKDENVLDFGRRVILGLVW